MIEITSLEDPKISEFRSLKSKNLLKDNLIVVEGEKVILKLLKSTLLVKKIYAPKWFLEKHKTHLRGEIYSSDKKIREEIIGHHLHQGIFALAEKPQEYQLHELSFPALILNGVTSPENVGSIVRSLAAFGVKSLIIGPKSCSPYLRRCIRVSMGNIFSIKVHHTKDLENTLHELKQNNIFIYGTANIPGSKNIRNLRLKKASTLILGSEGHGIDPEILELCDQIIKIPIDSTVAHLNVATAASILLYHLNTPEEYSI